MKEQRLKRRAIRYFLAQTSEDTVEAREAVMSLLKFRAKSAEELFKNPMKNFSSKTHYYVLDCLSEAADVAFIPNWWCYATAGGVKEFVKALRGEQYIPQDGVREASLLICYRMLEAQADKEDD